MSMLSRYVTRTVLGAMLIVLGLITTIDLIFTLADELGSTNQFYTAANAFAYVMKTLPTSVYELLPYIALGGAIIGLGVLASSQELLIMQAAGVKTHTLIGWVMIPVLGVMLFGLVLGEWVAPTLQQQAQSDRAMTMSGGQAISSDEGEWRKIGDQFIHINAIAPGGRELFGITIFSLNVERRVASSRFAQRGEYVDTDGQSYWRLYDVQQTVFGDTQLQGSRQPEYRWDVDMSPELLSVLLVRPDRQSISGLFQFARYFDSEGLDSSSYYLAFWKKLMQPLATLSLVLLAVSFVFGPLREATMGHRVFVAIAISLVFTIVQRTIEPVTLLYGISPFLAALLPVLLCVSIGVVLLRRV
ncbi:LPS export ABC transporter permease LptG [Pseudohongiella sp. SYSU M77423]|uniref:LPS export ABC transporter permease LptG n=1 Tax=Pseudohongiella sp. SYSU M77423 TaxID=3042312 RepID=UPI00247FFF61|nr:LPS export ABC transporter permease LptG [Pseudohongiella sp. SYSU M77423]MDH7943590.1 LPS export ABC transporter permease LptG [Pseudohongiella sp. SYSU M77423]